MKDKNEHKTFTPPSKPSSPQEDTGNRYQLVSMFLLLLIVFQSEQFKDNKEFHTTCIFNDD